MPQILNDLTPLYVHIVYNIYTYFSRYSQLDEELKATGLDVDGDAMRKMPRRK